MPTVFDAHFAIVAQFIVAFARSSAENCTPMSWYASEI